MITQDIELAAVEGPRYWKNAEISRNARQELCFTVTDMPGRVLDLGSKDPVQADKCETDCDDCAVDNENPGFDDGIEPKRNWPDVKIRLRAVPSYGQPALFDVQGTITDYESGKAVFHLTQAQTRCVGVFLAEIGLFRENIMLGSWPLYVSINPSVFDPTYDGDGMVTIPEIRLALMDEMPEDNFLLDRVEFKDYQILAAIRKPVELWNSLNPLDSAYGFNIQNFPFRYQWLQCTIAHLLEMAAHHYRRNDLPMQGGGLSIRDNWQHKDYEEKARELKAEFKEWAQSAKASMSVRDAFGTVSSPYRRAGYGNRG